MGFLEKLFKIKHKIESGDDAVSEEDPRLGIPETENGETVGDENSGEDNNGERPESAAEDVMPDPEKEKIENFKVDTVADFISLLELRIGEAQKENNDEMAQELFYQKVKILSGLNTADLSADGVRVREMQAGVLGAFDPNNKEIAASSALLNDFNASEQLFNTVFLHEATHRDGVADEGLCQLSVDMKISAVHGIYEWEKQKARGKFEGALGTRKTIELYNIKEPEKLANGYIEAKLKKEVGVKKIQEILADQKKLKSEVYKLEKEINKDLKDGAPRLHEKLRSGYDYKKEIEKAMNGL